MGEHTGWITYEIEGDVVVASLAGDYTNAQVRDFLLAARHDPRLDGPRGLLLDAREAAVNPPVDEIRSSIGTVASLRDGFRYPIQIVVSSTLHYGIGRMVSALAGLVDIEVDIHRDLDEARRHLGLASKEGRAANGSE